MKKRILEITYHGGTGGVAVLILNLVEQLKIHFDIEVCFVHSRGPIADEIELLGVKTHCLGLKSGFDLIGAFRLLKFLRNNNYDLIHLHYLTPIIRLAVFLYKPKAIILSEHGGMKGEKERKRWFITKYIHRLLRGTIDLYTTVSEENRREIVKERICSPEQCIVIYNGIDLNKFSPDNINSTSIKNKYNFPKDRFIIGTVRGLTPKMGIDHFILAFNYLFEKSHDIYGIIVGDGPLRKKLEELSAKLGINENILFLGIQRNIPELLSTFDIFVMPSVWEPFGIAAVEASAMKVPVVGYDVGGLSEVIENGKTGILVKERNPKLLAESILSIINKPELRKYISEEARNRTTRFFDIKKISQKYKKVYENIMKNAK